MSLAIKRLLCIGIGINYVFLLIAIWAETSMPLRLKLPYLIDDMARKVFPYVFPNDPFYLLSAMAGVVFAILFITIVLALTLYLLLRTKGQNYFCLALYFVSYLSLDVAVVVLNRAIGVL